MLLQGRIAPLPEHLAVEADRRDQPGGREARLAVEHEIDPSVAIQVAEGKEGSHVRFDIDLVPEPDVHHTLRRLFLTSAGEEQNPEEQRLRSEVHAAHPFLVDSEGECNRRAPDFLARAPAGASLLTPR